MPDWDEINKRLRESEEVEKPLTASDESWSGQGDRIQAEEDAKENARRNEPSMAKVKFTFKFDSLFEWLNKLRKL